MTVIRVRSISFEPLVGFTNYFVQMSAMKGRCAVPMFDQGQFNPWWVLQITLHKCQV